jgi:hypothetical protein
VIAREPMLEQSPAIEAHAVTDQFCAMLGDSVVRTVKTRTRTFV